MKNIVVIDIETTGLNFDEKRGKVADIIDIGAVKLIDGEITERFSSYVYCPNPISREITTLTGISKRTLKGAPPIKEALQNLKAFCCDCIVAGYNVDFDYGFLSYHGKKNGIAFEKPQMDILKLAQEKLKGQVPNFRISTVAEYFGIDTKYERVVDGAAIMAKILIKLLT